MRIYPEAEQFEDTSTLVAQKIDEAEQQQILRLDIAGKLSSLAKARMGLAMYEKADVRPPRPK